MRNRTSVLLGSALIAAVAVSLLATSAASGVAKKKVAVAGTSLKGICPATIVIQTDWFPEAEHGALYQLVGADYKIDLKKKVVSGSLIDHKGAKTGVNIEVRTGGPAIGFAGPSAVMATDPSITMGYDYTGSANLWNKLPLIQVVAPLEKNPQMVMWDPATYPDVKTIADLAKKGVTINVFAKSVMSFFIADKIVPDNLVDPSYDGSPARFVAANGKIAQQGFASAEPYSYKNDIKAWGKDVAFQLFFDAGYQDYSQTLGVRPTELAKLRPCLKKFVPMVQQAAIDFIKAPDRANAIIVDAVAQYKDFWVYSKGLADFSVAKQKELGLVSNGPDKTLGNFDIPRVQKFIDLMVKSGDYKDVPAGFKAETMVTNEFIDPKIGL
jgi:hypothetical protein